MSAYAKIHKPHRLEFFGKESKAKELIWSVITSALASSRPDVIALLRAESGAANIGGRTVRLRGANVIMQVALSSFFFLQPQAMFSQRVSQALTHIALRIENACA